MFRWEKDMKPKAWVGNFHNLDIDMQFPSEKTGDDCDKVNDTPT